MTPAPRLPPSQVRLLRAAALLALGAAVVNAQTRAPASSAPAAADSDAVVMTPFTVATDKDEGFVAAASLAGGRLTTELRDTPIAYSVLTRDFLDALNLFDQEQALTWSVGAYMPTTDVANYRYFNNEGGSSIVSRGVQTASPQRNFFLLGLNSDTFSQERIDFARGPNALLIGTSGLGGTVVTMTKQARTDRAFTSASQVIGSWNRFRTSFDINRPINSKVAVRANLIWQEADTWRDLEFDHRHGAHFTVTYRPFRDTRVRAEYEYYRRNALDGRENVTDRLSGWDGVTTVAAPLATLADADARGLARNGSSTAAYPVYIPGSDPDSILNWGNTWKTQGGAATAAVPVGGRLALSSANLGINNGGIVNSVYSPDLLFGLARRGANFVAPNRRTVIAPADYPALQYGFQDAAFFIDHRQGRHLFLEAAVHYADAEKVTEYLVARTLSEAMIDVNRTLPNGTPNPNFLQVYGDSITGHTHFRNINTEGRIAAALVFDQTRWGDFRANVIAGGRNTKSYTSQLTEVMNRSTDPRVRSRDDSFTYRYYWNDPKKPFTIPERVTYTDPIAGTARSYDVDTVIDLFRPGNQRWSHTRFNFVQAAANARLLQGRLNLIAGARRDDFRLDNFTLNGSANAVMHDYPANWDGQTIHYRPTGPADYWALTYTPKDAAGRATGAETAALTRPRDAAGRPLAQYTNDRFRDDFSSPTIRFNVDTVSYGGVLHVLRWLSVYANFAETFNPPTSGLTLTGAAVPPGQSEGWDAGLRFSLLDGRVSATIGRYGSTQLNNTIDSSGNTRKYADLAAANVVGDLSLNGLNRRGLALIPTPTFDFQDRKARGHEVDIVANLTRQWRLTANAGFPKVSTTNARQDEWAFLRAHEATLRQIAIDAGAVIGPNNVATVDLSIPVANRSPDVTAAVTAWNNIQNFKATNDPTVQNFSDLPDYTANLYTDYRIATGRLKNLRLGAGIQYIGRRDIGNRGGDTIINPANPATAIDDPNVNATHRVQMAAHYSVTATAGYQFKLREGRTLDLNLSIGNLLDNRDPIWTGAGLRAPNGDISRPDRMTVPTSFIYRQPRNFTLTARLGF